MLGIAAGDGEITAGERGGDDERAGLDAVGNNAVARAVQLVDPVHADGRVPAPSMCAPILISNSARSTTSGSQAQFSRCFRLQPRSQPSISLRCR